MTDKKHRFAWLPLGAEVLCFGGMAFTGLPKELVLEPSPQAVDAAVLAAANMADEMLKQQSSTENLRRQLKGYLDDANKAKSELSECKRELFKLQQQKK